MNEKNNAGTLKAPTLLEAIDSELYNYLNTQSALIARIESKLHLIWNMENKTEPDDSVSEKPADMVGNLRNNVRRVITHNELLEKIEKHLSEII